jgi:1-acyl-sn-glycerol-3-phosphate acyltransferase
LLGVVLDVRGEMSAARPTLFVSNHLSYLDITVLGAVIEGSFVAKREVANWPLFGWLARLQRTVFVERRPARVQSERDVLARRLASGDSLILFAEGTSGDGTHVRPFKTSLFAAAGHASGDRPLVVQPVTLAYTRLDGMPIGRQWRAMFAWYGDMDMLSHAWRLFSLGRITAELRFHPPVSVADYGSRKALADYCERAVREGLAAANSGREGTAATADDAPPAPLASPAGSPA